MTRDHSFRAGGAVADISLFGIWIRHSERFVHRGVGGTCIIPTGERGGEGTPGRNEARQRCSSWSPAACCCQRTNGGTEAVTKSHCGRFECVRLRKREKEVWVVDLVGGQARNLSRQDGVWGPPSGGGPTAAANPGLPIPML